MAEKQPKFSIKRCLKAHLKQSFALIKKEFIENAEMKHDIDVTKVVSGDVKSMIDELNTKLKQNNVEKAERIEQIKESVKVYYSELKEELLKQDITKDKDMFNDAFGDDLEEVIDGLESDETTYSGNTFDRTDSFEIAIRMLLTLCYKVSNNSLITPSISKDFINILTNEDTMIGFRNKVFNVLSDEFGIVNRANITQEPNTDINSTIALENYRSFIYLLNVYNTQGLESIIEEVSEPRYMDQFSIREEEGQVSETKVEYIDNEKLQYLVSCYNDLYVSIEKIFENDNFSLIISHMNTIYDLLCTELQSNHENIPSFNDLINCLSNYNYNNISNLVYVNNMEIDKNRLNLKLFIIENLINNECDELTSFTNVLNCINNYKTFTK